MMEKPLYNKGARLNPVAPVFFLSIVFLFVGFLPTLGLLASAWRQEEYSHAPLVVVLAALLAWRRLVHARPSAAPSWSGLLLVCTGLLFYLVGQLTAFNSGSAYGFVLALSGLVLSFFGWPVLKVCLPALVYLLFAIPLPQFVYVPLTADLQLISSSLGVATLNLLGVPVFQEGNIIDLGTLKLQIVEACSGLRYLFPLLSFGYLAAYLLDDRWWKRAFLLLSAIPITIGLNAVRIALTGIAADRWGVEMAQGFIHDFEGWVIFLVCVLVLVAEGAALRLIPPRGRFKVEEISFPKGRVLSSPASFGPAAAVATLLVAAFFGGLDSGLFSLHGGEVRPAHRPLREFPLEIGDWRGVPGSIDRELIGSLNLSDYLVADFTLSPEQAPVNFYVAYHDQQSIGASSHSPSNCIPGGGWRIADSAVRDLPIAWGRADGLRVSRIVIARGGAKALVYYWFDERGRDLTEVPAVKWNLLHDSLVFHRTDGALIRVVSAISQDEDEAAADARLQLFIGQAMPELMGFMPAPVL